VAAIALRLRDQLAESALRQLTVPQVEAALTPAERDILGSHHLTWEVNVPVVLTVPAPDTQLPPGVSVSEIVFPTPTDLQQRGADQPLSVFERQFAIGVVLKVDASATPGTSSRSSGIACVGRLPAESAA
jgi:hypothetical protein